MSLKEKYKDKKPIGALTVCNFGGIVILDIIDNDTFVIGENYGDGNVRVRMTAIHRDENGNGYVNRYGTRYNLCDFMRV